MPKLSIIITIKNETKFFAHALKKLYSSYIEATLANYNLKDYAEFIVVDGNSTDDNVDLYKKLQQKYGFILVTNDLPNKKVSDSPFGAFKKGLSVATGEYVSLWSVDDDAYPDYFRKMIRAIEEYNMPMYICSCDVARENERYERILYPFDGYVSPQCMMKNFKSFGHRINLVGSIFKREIAERFTLTKVNYDATYFFFNAFTKGFYNIGEKLILYRSYLNSHGQTGKWKHKKEWIKISKKEFKEQSELAYNRAMNVGFWDHQLIHHIGLSVFSKLPYFIRKMKYKSIYKYDCKEEK